MNELDLLLAETVEACRQRRQSLRQAMKSARPGKINLARPLASVGLTKVLGPQPIPAGA